MKQKTEIPLRDWRGRYAAFIMSAVYGNKELPNENFNTLRDYYRVDHNVNKSDLIKVGSLNADGSPNWTGPNAYDAGVALYNLVKNRRKERNHIRISRKIVEQQFEAAAHHAPTTGSSNIPDKTRRELLAEYYRIQSQMHAAMSRVCAELAEVA